MSFGWKISFAVRYVFAAVVIQTKLNTDETKCGMCLADVGCTNPFCDFQTSISDIFAAHNATQRRIEFGSIQFCDRLLFPLTRLTPSNTEMGGFRRMARCN